MCYYSDTLNNGVISVLSADEPCFTSGSITLLPRKTLLEKFVPDDVTQGDILLLNAAHGFGKAFCLNALLHYYESHDYEVLNFDLSKCSKQNMIPFFERLYGKFTRKDLSKHHYFVAFSHVYTFDPAVHELFIRVVSLLFNSKNRVLITTRPQYLYFYRKLYPLAHLVNKSDLAAQVDDSCKGLLQATHNIPVLCAALLHDRESERDVYDNKSAYLSTLYDYVHYYVYDYANHLAPSYQDRNYMPALLSLFGLGAGKTDELDFISKKLNISFADIKEQALLEDGFIEFNVYTSTFEAAGLCDDYIWQSFIQGFASYYKSFPELLWLLAAVLAQRGSYARCATVLNLVKDLSSIQTNTSILCGDHSPLIQECMRRLLNRGHGLIVSSQTEAVDFLLTVTRSTCAKTWSFQFLEQAYSLLSDGYLNKYLNEVHEGASRASAASAASAESIELTEHSASTESVVSASSGQLDAAASHSQKNDGLPVVSLHKRIPYVTEKTPDYLAYVDTVRALEYLKSACRLSKDAYGCTMRFSKSRAPLVHHVAHSINLLEQGDFLKVIHHASLNSSASASQNLFDILDNHTKYYAYAMLGLSPEGVCLESASEKCLRNLCQNSPLDSYVGFFDELVAMLSHMKPLFIRGEHAIQFAHEHYDKTFEAIFYIGDAIQKLLQEMPQRAYAQAQMGYTLAQTIHEPYLQQLAFLVCLCARLLSKEQIHKKDINCCEGFFKDVACLVLYSSSCADDSLPISEKFTKLRHITGTPSRNMAWIYAMVYRLLPACSAELIQNTPLSWKRAFSQFMKAVYGDFSWEHMQTAGINLIESDEAKRLASGQSNPKINHVQDQLGLAYDLPSSMSMCHELSYGRRVLIRCLDRFSVSVDGVAVDTRLLQKRHVNQLLGYLSFCPQHRSNRYNLISALWGDCDFEYGMVRLYETMSAARKALQAKLLPQNPLRVNKNEGMVFLNDEIIICDVDVFEHIAQAVINEGMDDLTLIDQGCRALSMFGSGVDLSINDITGRFYNRFEEVQNLFITVSELVSNAAFRQGRIRLALRVMQTAFSQAPLREDIVYRMLELLALNGRSAEIPRYLNIYKAQLHAIGVREIPQAIEQFARKNTRKSSVRRKTSVPVDMFGIDRLQN